MTPGPGLADSSAPRGTEHPKRRVQAMLTCSICGAKLRPEATGVGNKSLSHTSPIVAEAGAATKIEG